MYIKIHDINNKCWLYHRWHIDNSISTDSTKYYYCVDCSAKKAIQKDGDVEDINWSYFNL